MLTCPCVTHLLPGGTAVQHKLHIPITDSSQLPLVQQPQPQGHAWTPVTDASQQQQQQQQSTSHYDALIFQQQQQQQQQQPVITSAGSAAVVTSSVCPVITLSSLWGEAGHRLLLHATVYTSKELHVVSACFCCDQHFQ